MVSCSQIKVDMFLRHAFPVIFFALGGCASIVSGTQQSLSVSTAGPIASPGAQCKLVNDKGEWVVTAPGSVTVHRSYNELMVTCTHEAAGNGSFAAKSSTKGMAFGNVLLGGFIGAGVDMSTGAAYDYPNLIVVTMGSAAPASAPDAGPVVSTPTADSPTAAAEASSTPAPASAASGAVGVKG